MRKHLFSVALVLFLSSCGAMPVSTAVPATSEPAVTPQPAQVYTLGSTRIRAADGMVMVYVPAGEFVMGSADDDPDAVDTEKPQHTVTLDAFWIDRTEVTNAQYRQCVEAGFCSISKTCHWGEPTYDDSAKLEHPVICVSWDDAESYCAWAGGRLLTEAEWEYAARGPESLIYPWGDTFDCTLGNLDDETEIDDYTVPGGAGCDGHNQTAPVGSFPAGASWCGALDMAGNVWEWVADWYWEHYYAESPAKSPPGPLAREYRVARGGSWGTYQRGVRSAARLGGVPSGRGDDVGIRCAASGQP